MIPKLGIDSCFGNRPRAVIADEPTTTALGVTVQAQILELLAEVGAGHSARCPVIHR